MPRFRLSLHDWQMVAAVAEAGSVTHAATRISLSQSALSHRLLNLESALGLRLFDRVGKKMVPTSAGLSLASAANDILGQCLQAERIIDLAMKRSEPAKLNVATSCFSYYTWLADILAEFGAKRTEIDINIQLHATREEMPALDNKSADFVITAHPPKRSDLEQLQVFSQEVVAVVRKDHPLAKRARGGQRVTWSDLGSETLLIHDLPSTDEIALRDAVWGRNKGQKRKSETEQVRRVQLTEAIVALVNSGFGIGIMNRWLGRPPFDLSDMTWISITPRHNRLYWAVWRRDRARILPLAELASAIRSKVTAPSIKLRAG